MYPLQNAFVKTNPLSLHWRALAGHKGEEETKYWDNAFFMGANIPTITTVSVTMYIMGMIGYACSLITRVIGLVKDLFIFIVSFLCALAWALTCGCCFSNQVKNELHPGLRGYVLMGAVAELASGIIGCVCPPLAYALDERIHINKTWDHHSFSCTGEYVSEQNQGRLEAYKEEPLLPIIRGEYLHLKSIFPAIPHGNNGRTLLLSLTIMNLIEDDQAFSSVRDIVFLTSEADLKDRWAALVLPLKSSDPKNDVTPQLKRQILTDVLIQKLINKSHKINSPHAIFEPQNKEWLVFVNQLADLLIDESKKFLTKNGDRASIYFTEIFS